MNAFVIQTMIQGKCTGGLVFHRGLSVLTTYFKTLGLAKRKPEKVHSILDPEEPYRRVLLDCELKLIKAEDQACM